MGKKILAIITSLAVLAALAAVIFVFILNQEETISGGDLIIPKDKINEKAKFYKYKAKGTDMEVIAVKAPDGTIRTAFNTCQVCYDSGKGYYKQSKDELICQNCFNRFKISEVEVVHGGCNPVPILPENKVDDGENIIISQAFLEQNAPLFANWK